MIASLFVTVRDGRRYVRISTSARYHSADGGIPGSAARVALAGRAGMPQA